MKDCNNSVHWDFFVAVILQTKCGNLVKEAKILKYSHFRGRPFLILLL